MYAVVSSGGKQYRVEPGGTLLLERIGGQADESVTFDRVLLVADGDDVTVGTPTVAGATVSGTILREELGPKLIIFKFKNKIGYRRRTGHRQHLVRVRIDEITADGKTARAEKPEPKTAEPKTATREAVKSEDAEAPPAKPRGRASKKVATAESESKADTAQADAKADSAQADTKPRARRKRATKADKAVEAEADQAAEADKE